jgi:AAA15 family ATPase/GTPase
MEISLIQLINYKSDRDSGELQFSTGFTVLVGQNNVGKSTLLEALGLKFLSKPHKSLSVLPRFTSPVNPTSSAKVTLTVTREETKDILLSINGHFLSQFQMTLGAGGPTRPAIQPFECES